MTTTTESPAHRAPRIRPAARTRRADALALAGIAAVTALAPAIGAPFTPARPRIRAWYRQLEKPPFTPPNAAFGPVWTTLYALMAVSAWRVWRAPAGPDRTRALALWGTQLALNAAWTPLFFGGRRLRGSLVDILGVAATAGAYTAVSRRVDRPAAAMMLPLLGWLALATAVNAEIVRRNR